MSSLGRSFDVGPIGYRWRLIRLGAMMCAVWALAVLCAAWLMELGAGWVLWPVIGLYLLIALPLTGLLSLPLLDVVSYLLLRKVYLVPASLAFMRFAKRADELSKQGNFFSESREKPPQPLWASVLAWITVAVLTSLPVLLWAILAISFLRLVPASRYAFDPESGADFMMDFPIKGKSWRQRAEEGWEGEPSPPLIFLRPQKSRIGRMLGFDWGTQRF